MAGRVVQQGLRGREAGASHERRSGDRRQGGGEVLRGNKRAQWGSAMSAGVWSTLRAPP